MSLRYVIFWFAVAFAVVQRLYLTLPTSEKVNSEKAQKTRVFSSGMWATMVWLPHC